MDIKIVINKSIVYTLLVSILSVVYFCIIYMIENYFQSSFGYNSLSQSLLIITVITLLFIPLRHLIQNFIDRFIYKGNLGEITKKVELLEREVVEKEKFKLASTLASSIAHDIRSPATTLKTFLEHLEAKKDDREFIRKFMNLGSMELDRIEKLTDNLLEFSKPSQLEKSENNINQIINQACELIEIKSSKNNIQIKFYQPDTPIIAKVDSNKITQVLLNLFNNSIDAMPKGGELIIELSRKPLSKTYQLLVQDTGMGISKTNIKKIFKPFYTKKDTGTGLGLSITKTIIEDHGGNIKVQSKENQGTTFIITLPA